MLLKLHCKTDFEVIREILLFVPLIFVSVISMVRSLFPLNGLGKVSFINRYEIYWNAKYINLIIVRDGETGKGSLWTR